MNDTLKDNSVVVFDLETTGLYPRKGHRVIEIGAVRIMNKTIIDEFQSLVHVSTPIPKAIMALNGITDAMLQEQPEPAAIFPLFQEFTGRSVLVAHNAAFDMAFLRAEYRRLHMRCRNRFFCTMKMSKKLYPELTDYKLDTVAHYLLGKLPEGIQRHRALDDARVTALIWMEMARR